MREILVTFERSVLVSVSDDADEAQIKERAVEIYNNPPDEDDIFLTEGDISSMFEIVEVDDIG